jgi:hypothetical protein
MTDPTPELRGITKRLVKYKRADGVDLSFTLYLPAGYKEGTRLPAVFWAYPLDYSDAKMAGQVVGSIGGFRGACAERVRAETDTSAAGEGGGPDVVVSFWGRGL